MDKYTSRRVVREVVNLGSDYATQIYRGFVDSFLNPASVTLDHWRLVKLEMLENGYFEEEFAERQAEFTRQGLAQEELSTHYGFLAAANEELVDLTLREGLKVRFCPINALGYCIAGVHLCVHGDVCLQEAALETGDDGEQIVLVAFKFMFGRTKRVTPVASKDMAIIAPSPGFHCHIADVRPGRNDPVSDQYIRSLAYLYEFENSFYHPVPRPRQCSPLAALYLRRRRGSGCPPKPPQFLPPTAGRFPSAAVVAPSMPTSTMSVSLSALMASTSSNSSSSSSNLHAQQQNQQPALMRLTPDVANAVGSMLSELRQASSAAASSLRPPVQQPPSAPKLDGIRSFLKNATGGGAAVSGSVGTIQPLMQSMPPTLTQPPPSAASSKNPAQTSLLSEPPRRNAFLAAAGAQVAASSNRFHPYARIQTSSATSNNNNNSNNNSSSNSSNNQSSGPNAVQIGNRKSAFGVGRRHNPA